MRRCFWTTSAERRIAGLMLALGCLAAAARADILIDDFEDNNTNAIWDGVGPPAWADASSGLPIPGKVTRIRTITGIAGIGLSPGYGSVNSGAYEGTSVQYLTPVFTSVAPANKGTMALDQQIVAGPAEVWTMVCTAAAPNGGTFSVAGNSSGAQAPATVGVRYANAKIAFTLQDGTADFVVGDQFVLSTFDGIPNSTRPTASERMEWIAEFVVRNATYNATGLDYIRFTAWRNPDSIPARQYLQPNTKFVVGIFGANASTIAVGPGPAVDPDGAGTQPTDVPGVSPALSTDKQVYFIPFSSLVADPIINSFRSLPICPKTAIQGMSFGFRHAGPNTNPGDSSLFLIPKFFVDDIMFVANLPAVTITVAGGDTALSEAVPGDTITVNIVLTSMPSTGSVTTITAASGDLTEATVPGTGEVSFTPANWSAPQSVTIQVADDAINDGDIIFPINYAISSTDLAYAALPAPSATQVTTLDNEAPSILVQDDPVLVPEGSTAPVMVTLDMAPLNPVSLTAVFVSGDADLSAAPGVPVVLDSVNWETPQPIQLAAAEDADTTAGLAVFSVVPAAGPVLAVSFGAREIDNDPAPTPSPTPSETASPSPTDTETPSPTESATATDGPTLTPNAAMDWEIYE